jgi:hypothetical protein
MPSRTALRADAVALRAREVHARCRTRRRRSRPRHHPPLRPRPWAATPGRAPPGCRRACMRRRALAPTRSFGHFSRGVVAPSARHASSAPRPAATGMARRHSRATPGRSATERYSPPGGDTHTCPLRPRPKVCLTAATAAPCGAPRACAPQGLVVGGLACVQHLHRRKARSSRHAIPPSVAAASKAAGAYAKPAAMRSTIAAQRRAILRSNAG